MANIELKLHGLQDKLLDRFVDKGFAESREEALRFALLKSALDLGLIDQKLLVKEIRGDLGKDKKLVHDILKDIKEIKNESIFG
ncbi:hypothetical protein HYY74_05295 [Candidatus Woesearchaeota archaeon]|nr:hypothetical protein [Candidatus Woesearchaeota archaeon]